MKTAVVSEDAIVLRSKPTEKIDQQVHILLYELQSKGVTAEPSICEFDQTTGDMLITIALGGQPYSTADVAQFLLQLGFEIQDKEMSS